ncbi:MAG: PaaX family transcriptional regulator [Acidimicrobiales bacterium]
MCAARRDEGRQPTREARAGATKLGAQRPPDGKHLIREAESQAWSPSAESHRRSLQGGQSARSLLLTILGEYVLPTGATVWTSSLLQSLGLFGVEDKAGRQALARAAKAGWLESEHIGRQARWHLTERGRALLAAGSARIYGFDPMRGDWDSKWLVLVISIPEERRADRHILRTRLAWAGFGSLGQGVWLSPDARRRVGIEPIFEGLARPTRAVSFVAELTEMGDATTLVSDAWNLLDIEERYRAFTAEFAGTAVTDPALAFTVKTRLVHEWRKFPFIDPGLPTTLLPSDWPGPQAHALFRQLHRDLSPDAAEWFGETESRAGQRHTRQPSLA